MDAGLPWWNAAYSSRANLTITNTATSQLATGFQVGWPLQVQNLIGTGSFDQIRLVRWNGTSWSEQTRVIDDWAGANGQYVWHRLVAPLPANSTDKSFWLYWGNASPPVAPSDPAMVFDFFDTFGGATLGASWLTQTSNGITVASGEAQLELNESIRLNTGYGEGTAADFLVRQPTYEGRWWMGFQVAGTFADNNPWIIWIARNASTPADIWPEFTVDGTTIYAGPHVTGGATTALHLFSVDRAVGRVMYRMDGVVKDTYVSANQNTAGLNVRVTNESGQTLYLGQARVRATVYPYPTVTRGPTNP